MPKLTDLEQAEQAVLTEKLQLNYLPSKFPEEFKAICNLHPLQGKQDVIETLQLDLGEIVRKYRRRFSENYSTRIEECIRFADAATNDLEEVAHRFIQIDVDHIEKALAAANELDPHGFPESTHEKFINELFAITRVMRVLGPALMAATGASAKKRGPGAPPKPYWLAADELILLWEIITAEPMPPPYNKDIFKIEPVPTAKNIAARGKLRGNYQEYEFTQPSTEFCRLAFRMIDPKIERAQVVTAINNARTNRERRIKWLASRKGKNKDRSLLTHLINRLIEEGSAVKK